MVHVDAENTWTTLISMYGLAQKLVWKSESNSATGVKIAFFHGSYDFMVIASWISPIFSINCSKGFVVCC